MYATLSERSGDLAKKIQHRQSRMHTRRSGQASATRLHSRPHMAAYAGPVDNVPTAAFLVPRQLVKRVKTALERQGRADSTCKIKSWPEIGGDAKSQGAVFLIASTFGFGSGEDTDFLQAEGILDEVKLVEREKPIAQSVHPTSPMEIAVREWYSFSNTGLPPHITLEKLLQDLPRTYSIYGPLLLLPQHAFVSESWKILFSSIDAKQVQELFEAISRRMKVSHIATNAPIPLHGLDSENVIRSPTNLTPLLGDFGPACTTETPSAADFDLAFWCHTRQNGITMFWAPRYTMFSRGNITEKARVLNMPSVAAAISQTPDTGCCAIDLYAGIGYFTFSYLAAGVSKVLGWDINPWSIEGLRRGAIANKWDVDIISTNTRAEDVSLKHETRLLAFLESNELALARINKMRSALPPIRHVNCGLLPTSKGSYATAAAALDPELGGWVHVHENFALTEIGEKAEGVRKTFEHLINGLDMERTQCFLVGQPQRAVTLEHVQRVKSYAPGVFHCVVDLFIASLPASA